jgi:catechol 2,3-dioxygenase-like lactoylglutathione lyase family enzyme
MDLEIQHVEVHVSSIEKSKEFYVGKLGLEVLEEIPALNLIALKAGGVRISIFGGYEPNANPFEKRASTHVIFRTANLEHTVEELKAKGVEFKGEIFEAPGFIRDIATTDPDGNVIELAQYLRDPLKKEN